MAGGPLLPGRRPARIPLEEALSQPNQPGMVMSDVFLEHALTPHNLGVLPVPAHASHVHGRYGDSMEMFLRVDDGTIVAVRFMPHGCMHTTACGSALTCLVLGSSLEQASEVGPKQVEEALGVLPAEHRHCALLAVIALRAALQTHYQERRSPWKKLYGHGQEEY